MGKGLALEFKRAFPENYKQYERAAKEKQLKIGKLFVTQPNHISIKYIVNFPTKSHWKERSKIEYIKDGLEDLVQFLSEHKEIKSIAIPPLGCGNGGLNWNEVKLIIERSLKELAENIDIIIYEPGFNDEKIILQADEKLTLARTMFLTALNHYLRLGYSINLLVAQKTAYFLQILGEPLNLVFEKGFYGPYAQKLNHLLKRINGSYVLYDEKQNNPDVEIRLNPAFFDRVKNSQSSLTAEQKKRLEKLSDLIEGYESPYGMELLATVSFILESNPDYSADQVQSVIHNWTKRKKEIMKPSHIVKAYNQIKKVLAY